MAKKLDAERIERARHQSESHNRREEEKQRIQETIAKNRSGERKGKVIMPERKMYAFQESAKVRVAAYCRVSTAEEAQAGSFEMQVQHFTSVIENNPAYELVKIYTDEGVSGTSVDRRKGFQVHIPPPQYLPSTPTIPPVHAVIPSIHHMIPPTRRHPRKETPPGTCQNFFLRLLSAG